LGDPVLSLRSEIYDVEGELVNLALIHYRADRYRLSLELRLDGKAESI
jgi:DNA-binding GntR family transcriptional regulator